MPTISLGCAPGRAPPRTRSSATSSDGDAARELSWWFPLVRRHCVPWNTRPRLAGRGVAVPAAPRGQHGEAQHVRQHVENERRDRDAARLQRELQRDGAAEEQRRRAMARSGCQRAKITSATAMKPRPAVIHSAHVRATPIDRCAPAMPPSTPASEQRLVLQHARVAPGRERRRPGSRPPRAPRAPSASSGTAHQAAAAASGTAAYTSASCANSAGPSHGQAREPGDPAARAGRRSGCPT